MYPNMSVSTGEYALIDFATSIEWASTHVLMETMNYIVKWNTL